MKHKITAILMAFFMLLTMAACGAEEETTLTGMVVSVAGTVVQLMEMDTSGMEGNGFSGGERPQLPEGMEGSFDFGNFNPEDFDGTLPEGETFPQQGDGDWSQIPEGMTPPEGMTIPENGERPDFSGENGSSIPDFGSLGTDAETKAVDIGNAHISVEIDGGKASGSMEDIKAGTFVTVTMNGKGEVTNVLVSSQSGFGGIGSFPGGNRPSQS